MDGTGKLEVGNTFDVNDIIVKRQGTLSPLGMSRLTTDVRMSGGTLEFSLGTSDQFNITGSVEAAGELGFKEDGYNDPATRGDFNTFTLLVASDLEGPSIRSTTRERPSTRGPTTSVPTKTATTDCFAS